MTADLRFALRGLRRTPAFFVTATIILGLGIGMSVAIFTVFRTVLLRRLPVTDQDRIAVMWTYRTDPSVDYVVGTKDLAPVRRASKTTRDMAAVAHWPATASPFIDGDRSLTLNRGMVTGNFFQVLGARPALGRLFTPDDDVPPGELPAVSAARVQPLVLSYRAWREKFGGDSSVIGRRLREPLLGSSFAIVGVAPAGLAYPAGAEYWQPMWGGWESGVSSFVVARLAPGATLGQARDEYFAESKRAHPELDYRGAAVRSFGAIILGDVSPVLELLTAAVVLLLLIACLNVGNLLLVRASSRAREIAIRRALGAEYGDIVRQLVVEALVLAAAGGVLGLVLADGLLRTLIAFAPTNLPRLDDVQVAGAPVLLAILVSGVSVLAFGLTPALIAARADLVSPLRADGRSGTETRRRRAVRQTLVASQVALAMVMLGGAALLARSLERLVTQDLGYAPEHLSVFWYSWDARRYDSAAKLVELGDRVQRRLRQVPGVTSVTPIVIPPMLGNGVFQSRYQREGQTEADAQNNQALPIDMVGADYFKTFGTPLVQGRAFTDDDRETSPPVLIVSEAVARQIWPGESAVGKRLKIGGAGLAVGDVWRTVVGVAKDTHVRLLRESSPTVYFPFRQGFWQGNFAIRSTVPFSSLISTLRAAGHDVDPSLELQSPRTMNQVLDEPLAQPRLSAMLMSSFGVVALLLAAIGLYGVMTSLVRDETREIGVRMALGATPGRVRDEVLRRAGVVIGAGAAAGLGAALASSRVLATLLFHVSPTDPLALGGAGLVLLAVGAVAAYLPARRATRIDPVQALRAE